MARIVGDPPAANPLPSALTEVEIRESTPRNDTMTQELTDEVKVKRKFIRQNRDLVKNNAAQSVRIRTLELQVSQLLADNLSLREQNVQLQNASRKAAQQSTEDAVDAMKAMFEQRLAGLAELVDGLDALKSVSYEPIEIIPGTAVQGYLRERIPLAEAMRQCQMPTITEDKTYPRQTLDTQAIHNLRLSDHSSAGSPDLGPPPISRLDYEQEAVAEDVAKAAPREDVMSIFDAEGPQAELAANIDTRRKNKARSEMRTSSVFAHSPARNAEDAPVMLRTGAKRKLSDREPEKSSSVFSSEATNAKTTTLLHDVPPSLARVKADDSQLVKQPTNSKRRVLGDKNVNLSPRKKISTATAKPLKGDVEKKMGQRTDDNGRVSVRSRRTSSLPVPSPTHMVTEIFQDIPAVAPIILTDQRPKTPHYEDVLSPAISEPSSEAAKPRDTPPPGSLAAMSLFGAPSEAGRPSRRARSAVNYAEPSLVAKMRRPGKELADAVTGLQDHRRVMSTQPSKNTQRNSNEGTADTIKDAHRTCLDAAAGSPLHNRSFGGTREVATVSPVDVQPPDASVTSRLTTSAPAVSFKNHKRASALPISQAAAEDLDIYEFKDSSPRSVDDAPAATKSSRSQRRHTTIHRDPVVTSEESSGTDRPIANLGANRIDRAASRRKSMMV